MNSTLQSITNSQGQQEFVLTEELHTVLSIINLVTSLLGAATNCVNIAVFLNLGNNESINISLLGIAVSDFMVCLLTLLSAIFEIPLVGREVSQKLDINVIEVNYLIFMIPLVFFARITIVLTAFITIERCLCVVLPLKVKTLFTRTRVRISVFLAFVLVGLWMVPSYYLHRFGWRFNPYLNKTMFGLVLASDYDVINSWYTPADAAIFYVILYTLIIFCTVLLAITLKKNLKWRQSVTSSTKSKEEMDKSDQTSSSKETKIAKMVMIISFLFIVCYLPSVAVWIAKTLDPSFRLHGSKAHLLIVCGIFSFFTQSLNSGMNTLIYFKNSSNYRETFQQMFGIKGSMK